MWVPIMQMHSLCSVFRVCFGSMGPFIPVYARPLGWVGGICFWCWSLLQDSGSVQLSLPFSVTWLGLWKTFTCYITNFYVIFTPSLVFSLSLFALCTHFDIFLLFSCFFMYYYFYFLFPAGPYGFWVCGLLLASWGWT